MIKALKDKAYLKENFSLNLYKKNLKLMILKYRIKIRAIY